MHMHKYAFGIFMLKLAHIWFKLMQFCCQNAVELEITSFLFSVLLVLKIKSQSCLSIFDLNLIF